MNEYPPKGTIIRRLIRGKERFYHQWRENGVTKSRYLKADEVLPLREYLESAKTGTEPLRTGSVPLFSSGVLIGNRLRELTADVRRLTPREIFPLALSRMATDPLFSLVGNRRSGKTTLLKELILSLSDEILPLSAYISPPTELTSAEFLADLDALFSRGIRRFFVDGLERSSALMGTVPVLSDLYVARGCSFVLTATLEKDLGALGDFPFLDLTRISFRDFSVMRRTDSLEDYLLFRGLEDLIASAPPPSPHLGAAARKRAREKLRRECAEKLLKDLVLEETRLRRSSATVEVLAPILPSGGVDMIVVDHEELTCELYEVRYSLERDDKFLAHLENSRNLDHLEHLYGMITAREVLYLGRNAWHHAGIFYRNLSTYLRQGCGSITAPPCGTSSA